MNKTVKIAIGVGFLFIVGVIVFMIVKTKGEKSSIAPARTQGNAIRIARIKPPVNAVNPALRAR